MSQVHRFMLQERENNIGRPLARTGCLFEQNDVLPWPIPYGGFAYFLNKEAVQRMVQPLYCDGIHKHSSACSSLEKNRIGERGIFEEGMSVLELFYKYSAIQDFCMHSDWIVGFMVKYYIHGHEQSQTFYAEEHGLLGMLSYPLCGNFSDYAGEVIRPCDDKDSACHKQGPRLVNYYAHRIIPHQKIII